MEEVDNKGGCYSSGSGSSGGSGIGIGSGNGSSIGIGGGSGHCCGLVVPRFRILSKSLGATDAVRMLGLGDALILSPPYSPNPSFALSPSCSGETPEETTMVERVLAWNNLDRSLLAELEPNVIFVEGQLCETDLTLDYFKTQGWDDEGGWQLPPNCKKCRVISLRSHIVEDILRNLRMVASACNMKEMGERLARELQSQMNMLKRRTPQWADGVPPLNVACLVSTNPIIEMGYWVPESLRIGGGQSLMTKPGCPPYILSWEELLQKDPDVIVIFCNGYDIKSLEKATSLLGCSKEWGCIKAVRANRLFLADFDRYLIDSGPKVVSLVELMVEILHGLNYGHEGQGFARWGGEGSFRINNTGTDEEVINAKTKLNYTDEGIILHCDPSNSNTLHRGFEGVSNIHDKSQLYGFESDSTKELKQYQSQVFEGAKETNFSEIGQGLSSITRPLIIGSNIHIASDKETTDFSEIEKGLEGTTRPLIIRSSIHIASDCDDSIDGFVSTPIKRPLPCNKLLISKLEFGEQREGKGLEDSYRKEGQLQSLGKVRGLGSESTLISKMWESTAAALNAQMVAISCMDTQSYEQSMEDSYSNRRDPSYQVTNILERWRSLSSSPSPSRSYKSYNTPTRKLTDLSWSVVSKKTHMVFKKLVMKVLMAALPADCLLLSGGIGSGILAEVSCLNNVGFKAAITTLAGPMATDKAYAEAIAERSNLAHIEVGGVEKGAAVELLKNELYFVIKVLKTFDPITIRNSIPIMSALKEAKLRGFKSVMTGDGMDTLFSRKNTITCNSEDLVLNEYWKSFPDNVVKLGASLGLKILQPFLHPSIVEFANGLKERDLVGIGEGGQVYDMFILRSAFSEAISAWRRRDTVEIGSGTAILQRYFTKHVTKQKLRIEGERIHLEDGVYIRDAEHLAYYMAFKKIFNNPASSGLVQWGGSNQCSGCGYEILPQGRISCFVCGLKDNDTRGGGNLSLEKSCNIVGNHKRGGSSVSVKKLGKLEDGEAGYEYDRNSIFTGVNVSFTPELRNNNTTQVSVVSKKRDCPKKSPKKTATSVTYDESSLSEDLNLSLCKNVMKGFLWSAGVGSTAVFLLLQLTRNNT